MRKHLIIFTLLVLTGCANYQHENPSPDSPKITFGDRFGDDGDARTFRINTQNNICKDYKRIGTLSNNWMGIGSRTITITAPKDEKFRIYVNSSYYGSSSSSFCEIKDIAFKPEGGMHYSIDIQKKSGFCRLSIVEILPDGTHSNIETNKTREPKCI